MTNEFIISYCIDRGQAKPNETVLVHGASGGVSRVRT